MKTTRYAVIGSNCFTGCHFVDALLNNPTHQVIGISRSPEKGKLYLPYKSKPLNNFKFHQIDLVRQMDLLFSVLDDFKPDYVINVAALSEVALSNHQPVEYFQVNTLGTVNLCNRLRFKTYLKRYLHISSAEIYGSCPATIREETPLNPSTPYAVSKAAADMYLLTLHKNFNFPVTLIRSTNVYGKHQQLFKIIPRTIINLKKGQKISLHGGGKAVKSFIHIRDVVQGSLKILSVNHPSPIYHFSTKNGDTIADVVNKICVLMGRSLDESVLMVGERLGQDARYTLNFSKAEKELGWSAGVTFEEGVKEVLTWIGENWQEITHEPLEYAHKV